jgi:uncharacterized protein Yka (UPF0111/DUF47 family)
MGSDQSAPGRVMKEDSASIISSMERSPEEWEKFWAHVDDLEKRAAETDKQLEERKEEIARLIERIDRIQRRLLRYC